MVMWRSVSGSDADAMFDAWMASFMSDTSNGARRAKVRRAKPRNGVNGCYDRSTPPLFIADALVFSSRPVSRCSALYPVYSNVRHEAGGPLAANVLKCQLEPVDARKYGVPFTAAEAVRLQKIFSGGVCDWSKPGVNQVPVVTWGSFGPSPHNLSADATRP